MIPRVSHGEDTAAAPRGTIVRGVLKEQVDAAAMSAFVQDFVQYAEEHVFFNGELISRRSDGRHQLLCGILAIGLSRKRKRSAKGDGDPSSVQPPVVIQHLVRSTNIDRHDRAAGLHRKNRRSRLGRQEVVVHAACPLRENADDAFLSQHL